MCQLFGFLHKKRISHRFSFQPIHKINFLPWHKETLNAVGITNTDLNMTFFKQPRIEQRLKLQAQLCHLLISFR